ncbi:MAG: hypothetical protein FJ290_10675 [Planctomycetes bacterium]|nr:hypothetical protein [Planctomycetota bacterium]
MPPWGDGWQLPPRGGPPSPSPPPATGGGEGEGGGAAARGSCQSSPRRDKLGGGENTIWQGVQMRYCTQETEAS